MKFSQRIGETPSAKELQLKGIDIELRNGLWDCVAQLILHKVNSLSFRENEHDSLYTSFYFELWHSFYKIPYDSIPTYATSRTDYIRGRFYKDQWYEIYDFIEFIVRWANGEMPEETREVKDVFNSILKREFSGYRFINGVLSPISNTEEGLEIEKAIENTLSFSANRGANIHLTNALTKLSDKKVPDYRNSIKESISAVESVAKVISENSKDTLGGALDSINAKLKIHAAFIKGVKQIYGYTSDGDGIRHSLMDESNCDFEDAQYMLISCSAFINYLIAKAQKTDAILK